jgi:hypothetical protein
MSRLLELPLRPELAAFLAPFAYFGAGVAFFGDEAGFEAALQLDGSDALRLRGVVGGRIETDIKCQLLQLLKGHIRSRQGRVYVSDVLGPDWPYRTSSNFCRFREKSAICNRRTEWSGSLSITASSSKNCPLKDIGVFFKSLGGSAHRAEIRLQELQIC